MPEPPHYNSPYKQQKTVPKKAFDSISRPSHVQVTGETGSQEHIQLSRFQCCRIHRQLQPDLTLSQEYNAHLRLAQSWLVSTRQHLRSTRETGFECDTSKGTLDEMGDNLLLSKMTTS